MSIAVSTVVMPSRRLALLMAGFCVGVAAIAWQLVFGAVSDMPLALRVTLTVAFTVLPGWASYRAICPGKSLRIDISEHGQIRVAEDKACIVRAGRSGCRQAAQAGQASPFQQLEGTVVTLLPDSTIWPNLLLLRLHARGHGTKNVLILRDCMSAEHFRAVSVACLWIAAHNDRVER